MICYLKGEILDLQANKIEILTQWWVAYEVWISEINYAEIFDKKLKDIELFIYHNITDNSQALYGFLTRDEKNIFEQLIKISWVWWKVALLILSLWKNTLFEAIAKEDKKTIESVKWIGKKMAEKIILELKDKDLFTIWYLENKDVNDTKNIEKLWTNLDKTIYDNVKITLVNMWYNAKNIDKVLAWLPNELTDLEEILPWVIREMG